MGSNKVLRILGDDVVSLALLQDRLGDIGREQKSRKDELKIWRGKRVRVHKNKYTAD